MSRGLRIGIITGTAVVAAVLALLAVRHEHRYPSTDDAYVEADVVGIVAQVAGPIVNLAVEDNQPVRAGELIGFQGVWSGHPLKPGWMQLHFSIVRSAADGSF